MVAWQSLSAVFPVLSRSERTFSFLIWNKLLDLGIFPVRAPHRRSFFGASRSAGDAAESLVATSWWNRSTAALDRRAGPRASLPFHFGIRASEQEKIIQEISKGALPHLSPFPPQRETGGGTAQPFPGSWTQLETPDALPAARRG